CGEKSRGSSATSMSDIGRFACAVRRGPGRPGGPGRAGRAEATKKKERTNLPAKPTRPTTCPARPARPARPTCPMPLLSVLLGRGFGVLLLVAGRFFPGKQPLRGVFLEPLDLDVQLVQLMPQLAPAVGLAGRYI